MRRITRDGLVYYQFEGFQGTTLGIFTRLGGISPTPFHTLNVGATVGDDPENVRFNRERVYAEMAIAEDRVYTVWQTHSADVLIINEASPQTWPPPQADGLITDQVDLALMMRYADCVPLLFYDPIRKAVGIAHAGWQGTLARVGPATVKAMEQAFGSNPADVVAGIGPSIGPCCYEVGHDVVESAWGVFGEDTEALLQPGNGQRPHLDLWAANALALRRVGVTQIELAELCTACHTSEFFSHRAEHGRTGRFGAVIALEQWH